MKNVIQRYRKRPVVIEASEPITESNIVDIADWCHGLVRTLEIQPPWTLGITVTTREGDLKADIGDRIIRGVQGEFYPIKPDIFDATYEPE
jgi:hypothetical protein